MGGNATKDREKEWTQEGQNHHLFVATFFLAGHLSSYRSLPSELLGGFSTHSFWNQKRVIWNREHSAISWDFWPKSPQWGSSNSNCHHLTALLQHCSITEPLGGLREYSLAICCLFYFDLTHSCASQGLWVCNFSTTAEWCTSYRLWVVPTLLHLSFIL